MWKQRLEEKRPREREEMGGKGRVKRVFIVGEVIWFVIHSDLVQDASKEESIISAQINHHLNVPPNNELLHQLIHVVHIHHNLFHPRWLVETLAAAEVVVEVY